MNKLKFKVIFVFILVLILAGGCGDPLKTPQGDPIKSGVGGGGAEGDVPGTIKWTVDDLITTYNASEGKNGMRLVTITQAASYDTTAITTQETLGLWPDTNKFHIHGFTTGFGDGFRNQGFVDVLLLYYDRLFEEGEEFTISARIRMNRVGGVSTSKGVHFGAYTDRVFRDPDTGKYTERKDDAGRTLRWGPNQNSKGLGMFFRGEAVPNFRMYYSCNLNSTTAGAAPMLPELTSLTLTREYIYVLSRRIDPANSANSAYRFWLLDSKTCEPVVVRNAGLLNEQKIQPPSLTLDSEKHPVTPATSISMHPSLREGVYAGITIAGSIAEISQIKIWDVAFGSGNVPVLETGLIGGVSPITQWDFLNNYMSDTMENDGQVRGPSGARKPIFWTPDTKAAYVPAREIQGPNNTTFPAFRPEPSRLSNKQGAFWVHNVGGGLFQNEVVPAGNRITITPERFPSFAEDDIWFEFFQVPTPANAPEGSFTHPALSIAGHNEYAHTIDGVTQVIVNQDGDREVVPWKVYERGVISINTDPAVFVPGTTASAWFKIVARDLNLETEEMRKAPDYPQLQTLPEYLFRINITRPAL
jgi:hypothetical protein